jgi:hypothetical protein
MKHHELLSLLDNFDNGIAIAIGSGLLGLLFLFSRLPLRFRTPRSFAIVLHHTLLFRTPGDFDIVLTPSL